MIDGGGNDKWADDYGAAFPCQQLETQDGTWNQTYDPGMSLRDYFAAKAMQGMLAYPGDTMRGSWHNNSAPHEVASAAYEYADAMLAGRAFRKKS